jgi:hypothetical protein
VKKIVAKGPFMEYLQTTVASSLAVATEGLPTPVSKTEELAMLIHQIMIDPADPTFSAGVVTTISACVTDESHEGDGLTPPLGDRSVLYKIDRRANEGIVAGAFSRIQSGPMIAYFDPPILYAKSTIYCEAEHSANAGGGDCEFKIGYTLEKVSRDDFIAALVE